MIWTRAIVIFSLVGAHLFVGCKRGTDASAVVPSSEGQYPLPLPGAVAGSATDIATASKTKDTPLAKTIDLSWVDDREISCAKKGCIPSAPVLFIRPEKETPMEESGICFGVLIEGSKVLTSRGCIPQDVASGEASCQDRIVFKFPKLSGVLSQQNVTCESIEDLKPAVQDKTSFQSGYAILKMSRSIARKPFDLNVGFEQTNQFFVPHISPADSDNAFKESLTRKRCSVVHNKFVDGGKSRQLMGFDCGLIISSGSPIFRGDIASSQFLLGGHFDTSHALIKAKGDVSDYHTNARNLKIGISNDCIGRVDCRQLGLTDVFDEDFEADLESDKQIAQIDELNLEDPPLKRSLEWSEPVDIAKIRDSAFELYSHPTLDRTFNRSADSGLRRRFVIEMAVPSCLKTTDRHIWLADVLQADFQNSSYHKTGAVRRMESMLVFRSADLTISLPVRIRRHYSAFGASSYTGKMLFNIEINSYDGDWTAFFSSKDMLEEHIAFNVKLGDCRP